MAFTDKIKKLTAEYGIAWVIVNQTLGWITYFMVYAFLLTTHYDITAFLKQYKYTQSLASIGPTAGNLALAFALNRLGTPLRILLTTALMPYCATRINDKVRPYLRRFGLSFLEPSPADFPGVEEINKED